METADAVIDYSYSTIRAEQALKRLHYAMLERNHTEAIEAGYQAIVEVRLAIASIREHRDTGRW